MTGAGRALSPPPPCSGPAPRRKGTSLAHVFSVYRTIFSRSSHQSHRPGGAAAAHLTPRSCNELRIESPTCSPSAADRIQPFPLDAGTHRRALGRSRRVHNGHTAAPTLGFADCPADNAADLRSFLTTCVLRRPSSSAVQEGPRVKRLPRRLRSRGSPPRRAVTGALFRTIGQTGPPTQKARPPVAARNSAESLARGWGPHSGASVYTAEDGRDHSQAPGPVG